MRKELKRTRKARDQWCREYVRARDALAGLVTKLDEVHADPTYKNVWMVSQLHGGPYRGPNYDAELTNARQALDEFITGGEA